MQPRRRAYIELHIAVILFGFTAILGDLISLSAIVLVWWRVLITSLSLLLLIRVGKLFRDVPRDKLWKLAGIGVLVGIHWITFYGSVKLANASIALVCFATTPFFTAFIEPLISKQRIKWVDVALSLLVVPAMILIVNSTDLGMMPGIWIGLFSALVIAFFAAFNKKMVGVADELSVTFIELGSACLFISIILPFYFIFSEGSTFWPTKIDWVYLLVLALLCTTFAYVLALRSLRHISAFASNLTINLEPIYGVVLAIFILKENEELSLSFYIGALLLMLTVFFYPLISKRFSK